jgi:hypothetical protein
VWSAARRAGHETAFSTERRQYFGSVGDHVNDSALRLARRTAISRTRRGDESEPARVCRSRKGSVLDTGSGGAVVVHERYAPFGSTHVDIEETAVGKFELLGSCHVDNVPTTPLANSVKSRETAQVSLDPSQSKVRVKNLRRS